MKTTSLKRDLTAIAADGTGQSTPSAGGKLHTEKDNFRTDRPCHVYVVTLRGTDKAYVGITTRSVKQRWHEHRTRTIKQKHLFGNALRSHGADAFDCEWLGTLECWADGCAFEKFCKAQGLAVYNSTDGGEGSPGRKFTPEQYKELLDRHARTIVSTETRRRISEAAKKRGNCHPIRIVSQETRNKLSEIGKGRKLSDDAKIKVGLASKGRKHTPEAIEKIVNALTGRPVSEETRAKISCSNKGGNPNKGHTWTEEEKQHLSEVKKGKPVSEETRLKISQALSGKTRAPHSQETKDRISQALKGKPSPHKGKTLSKERCEAMRLSRLGYKPTPESVEKQKATKAAKKCQRLYLAQMPAAVQEIYAT